MGEARSEVAVSLKRGPALGNLFLRAGWIDSGLVLLNALPLLLTAHLPLGDLPDHLARQYILRDWASSSILQSIYQIHWALVPNLALDLFVLPLRPLVSPETALRLFCICTVLLLFCGTKLVNRTLSDRTSRAYRLVPFLTFGGPFQLGFMSYCLGVGLALVWFGSYLRFRRRSAAVLGPLLIIWGFTIILCHLAAFGLFALAVGGCEIATAFMAQPRDWRASAQRTARALALPVFCLTALLVAFIILGPSGYHNPMVEAAVSAVQFDFFPGKLRGLYAITGFSSVRLEGGLLILALVALGVALVAKAVRIHPIGATAVMIMLMVWLILPIVADGTSFIDYRLPWAISFFALASLTPGPRAASFRLPLSVWGAALIVGRIGTICAFWLAWEPALAEIDQALGRVPVGTKLYVLEGKLPGNKPFHQPELNQVASYVVARRQGFHPGMFVSFPGQILDLQPQYERIWMEEANLGRTLGASLDRVPIGYDYVLVLLPGYARLSPHLPLRCAAAGRLFDLYQVRSENEPSPSAGLGSWQCQR
jgi:hypothetical protein